MKYRVYRALKTPFSGSKQYYDVKTQLDAIKLTKHLNSKAKKKDWSWA